MPPHSAALPRIQRFFTPCLARQAIDQGADHAIIRGCWVPWVHGQQFKGTGSAKEARKVTLALEADAKFKLELAARKGYERCEKMPAGSSSRSAALKTLIRRFPGTLYADKAKEAVESAGVASAAGKQARADK